MRKTCVPLSSALLLGAALSASAQIWTGGGANDNLSNPANWGGTAPTPGNTTVLTFAGSTRTTPVNDFAANSAFGSWLLDSSATDFTITGNAITLNAGITNNSTGLLSLGLNGITATAALSVKCGSGDILCSSPISLGANSLTVSAANHTLTLTNGAGLGGSGTFTLASGTLELNPGSGNSFTSSAKIAMNPSSGLTAALNFRSGTANFTQTNFFTLAGAPGTATLNIWGGTFNVSHGGTGQRFMIGSQGTGFVNINGGTLAISANTGTIELGGDNQYSANNASGTLTINSGGTMTVGKNTSYGFELGRNKSGATGAKGTLNLFGGTLATARNIAGADGSSYVVFSGGTLKALSGATTLLTGLTSATVSTNGAIIDDGGIAISIPQALLHDSTLAGADGGLTKQGSSTLTLSRVNTYSGPTAVNGGKLVGVVGSSCASSVVTVANTPGCTLGISVTNNAMQWTCGGLAFGGSSATLDFNFGAVAPSTTVAPLQVNGDVDLSGNPAVTLETTALPAGPGTYPLLRCTGTMSGGAPSALTLPPHAVGSLSVVGNTLQLTITETATQPMTWTAGNGTWDINTTPNWQDANAQTGFTFVNGDTVVFNDTPSSSGPFTVSLNSVVAPASVTVSNVTKDYSISGTGTIGGGALTKQGTGTLTLSTSNSYSSTVVQAGTLAVSADNNLGLSSGGVTLSGATLHTTATMTSGRNFSFSGSSALQVDPATALTLTVSTLTFNNAILDVNPTSGGDLYLNGKVVLANASASGVTNNVRSGTVNLTNSLPLVLGDGTTSSLGVMNVLGGTLNLNQPGGQHIMLGNMGTGAINIAGGAVVVGGGSGTVSVGGDPSWSLNNASGTLTLSSGSLTINGSLVQLGMNDNRTGPHTGAKGTLNLFGGTLTTAGTIAGGNSLSYVVLSGGTLASSADNSAWLTNLTSATVSTNGAIIDDGGHAVTIPQALVHDAGLSGADGGLTKNGLGTLTLSGANTYNGPSTLNAGTLLVNGTHSGGSSYTVGAGATLGGNGSIDLSAANGNVTLSAGGTLSPGAATHTVGTLTLALGSGTLDLSAAAATAGTLVFDLAATNASDTITLSSGALNIGNGLLNFASFAFNNVSAVPGTYTLLHANGGITGSLGSNLTGTLAGGLPGTLSIRGNDVVLTVAPLSTTLAAPSRVGNQFNFTFSTVLGQNYQVEYTTDLSSGTWTPLGTAVAGTGAPVSVTNDISGGQIFYRLRIQ